MSAPPGYEANTITIVIGDDFQVDRPISGIPTGQAVAQVTWTVKRLEDFYLSGDATAVWQKIVTTTDRPGVGRITDNGALTGSGFVVFEGTRVESLLLTPGREYVYDFEVVSTAGKHKTYELGMLVAHGQVTQS